MIHHVTENVYKKPLPKYVGQLILLLYENQVISLIMLVDSLIFLEQCLFVSEPSMLLNT